MESFLHLFEKFKFNDEAFERVFIEEGRTPDTVCAALTQRLDILDGQSGHSIARNPEAQRLTRLALTRLISILAEHADIANDEVEELFKAATRAEYDTTPAAPTWKYPIINEAPSRGGFGNGDFKPFSALKMFGYTVGVNGWKEPYRQQFLNDFMTCELPADVEREFPNEYGAPMTARRLRKVANVIASNCSNFMRNDQKKYERAISHWKADLKFLKDTFYERHGLKFDDWPTPG